MSTGLECEIIEAAPGQWYYVLQDGSCPVDAWDWLEYATAYGPFTSEDASLAHLHNHHANPGGYTTAAYNGKAPTGTMAQLIAKARR